MFEPSNIVSNPGQICSALVRDSYHLSGKRAVLLAQLAPSHTRDDARLGYSLQLVPGWIRLMAGFRRPAGIAGKCRGY